MSGLDYDHWTKPVPIEYEVARVEHERVTIVRARQRDKSHKWKVMRGPTALTKSGDWVYESMPSSRTDAYLAQTRFDSLKEATEHAQVAAKAFVSEMQGRYALMIERQRKRG